MVDSTSSPIEWENEMFEDNQDEKWTVKQNILFLIDASKPMFGTFKTSTYFKTSIEICKAVVMKLIRKSQNDKIGIILFGTNDDNKTYPKYINVVSLLNKPNIELIKKLDDLMLADENRYGQSPEIPLADGLWYSNYLIQKSKENQSCNTIMLITCNDQPNIINANKKFNLRKRLDDVIKNNIDFKLIPIGAAFNMKLFYEDILRNFIKIVKPTNGLENVDDIMSEIYDKIKQSRSVSKLNFFIDNDCYICISLFKFYSKTKIPWKIKLDKRTNKELASVNQVFTLDNNELMYKSDLSKYCIIADETIIFDNEDISILKTSLIDPCIRLLAFVNKNKILIHYHFKTATFIRPNNDGIESSSLFNCLVDCCIEMNKVIICYIKIRQGGRIHLAALLPQPEIENEYNTQPSGFHVIYLPFFDCLKPIKEQPCNDNLPEITDEQQSVANLICKNMQIDYRPSMIKNPKINFHWAMLEAMALESNVPNVLDETLLSNDIENKLKIIENDVYEHLFPLRNNQSKVVQKKRTTSNNDTTKVIKRKK